MKLASQVVRNVNKQKDKDGCGYAREAMIRTGLSLNLNGIWDKNQLSKELRDSVAKNRNNFDGLPVHSGDVETESETE